MKTFGFKAFLSAVALFASVYLVRIAIKWITQIGDTLVQITVALAFLILILLILILPTLIRPAKPEKLDKDKNTEP